MFLLVDLNLALSQPKTKQLFMAQRDVIALLFCINKNEVSCERQLSKIASVKINTKAATVNIAK